jgi:hypothetical protein
MTHSGIEAPVSPDAGCTRGARCEIRSARTFLAGWSSPEAREPHKLEVGGSNPSPATISAPTEESWRSYRKMSESPRACLGRADQTNEQVSRAAKGSVCKTDGFGLRWFESSLAHQEAVCRAHGALAPEGRSRRHSGRIVQTAAGERGRLQAVNGRRICGGSSVVELLLAKQKVEGSIPFPRSNMRGRP